MAKHIKYCIWDVGQTIYPFTLNLLESYCLKESADKDAFIEKGGIKAFDFKPLMRGVIDFKKFCQEVCDYSAIAYQGKRVEEIDAALKAGVGAYFSETLETMALLRQKGGENCILSNALPNLADSTVGLVEDDKAFTSFELGLLKPDERIYQAVLQKLRVLPEEVVFVDDKLDNVTAARALGIKGIVYDKKTIKSTVETLILEGGEREYFL